MYNLEEFPSILSKDEIINLMNSYIIPKYPINNQQVVNNRNINNIQDKVNIQYGITTNKTILKSFPSNEKYSQSKKDRFNRLNLTSLPINTSILILHQSKDTKWYFIISPIYIGWILGNKVYLCNRETCLNNNFKTKFITITEPFYRKGKLIFDMGTKLNYKILKNKIYVKVYTNKGLEKLTLPKSIYVINHLKLNKENILSQAFKYLNTKYELGDSLTKIDCSSFVRNVLATCNYFIPRDTKDIFQYLDINNNLEDSTTIKLLHFQGHIAIYLGKVDDKDYYIHANARHMKVTIDYLNANYLDYQDLIGISDIK